MNPGPVHLFHYTFGRGGGIERYALTICRGLRAANRRVVFHCIKADMVLAQEMDVEVHCRSVARFPRKLRAFSLFQRVARESPRLAGLQIALTRVCARDAIICGGTHRGYLSRARKLTGPFDLLQIWMETKAYQFARRIVSHSHLCSRELVDLYQIPSEKIVTLHPPVDASFTSLSTDLRIKCRKKLGLPVDRVILLFPSTGHKRKGLVPICEALRSLDQRIVLAVAGEPPRGLRAPYLVHLGYVENMAMAYAAADFTILGSSYEPFGLVGVESVLCGTRLIFEEKIGCLEVVKPEVVHSFSVWDKDSIQYAVRSALRLVDGGGHRILKPQAALTYDTEVAPHVARLLDLEMHNPYRADARLTGDQRGG